MLSLALLLLAAADADREWMEIGTANTKSVIYARAEDLARGNSQSRAARLWIKIDARRDKTVDFSEMKTMYVVDCTTQSYRTVAMQVYYSDGSTKSVETSNKVEFIVPDTFMSTATDVLCWDGPEPEETGYKS